MISRRHLLHSISLGLGAALVASSGLHVQHHVVDLSSGKCLFADTIVLPRGPGVDGLTVTIRNNSPDGMCVRQSSTELITMPPANDAVTRAVNIVRTATGWSVE